MIVRKAKPEEAERTLDFYYHLIDTMKGSEYAPRWYKGVYPVLEDMETAACEENLFLGEEQGRIIGAFILSHKQNPCYANVSWTFPADPDKTAVVHLLATDPEYQGHGIGRKLLEKAVLISSMRGDEVMRLDTLTWNVPGQKLYEGFGFHCCGDVDLDYPSTGMIPFRMYEYRIPGIKWNRTALLVIDMQNAFVEEGQPLCVAGADATVPDLIKSVSFMRSNGGKVIWIRREYEPDGSDMEPFRREQMQKAGTLDVMAKGSYGAKPVIGLEGEPEDHVVIKKRFSGFFRTDLKEYLDRNDIDTVFVTGTQTPNCVRATAFDAVAYDYRTIVIADCTSSMNQKTQMSNLEDMENAGIEVGPTLGGSFR